jgi:hypothetical protein
MKRQVNARSAIAIVAGAIGMLVGTQAVAGQVRLLTPIQSSFRGGEPVAMIGEGCRFFGTFETVTRTPSTLADKLVATERVARTQWAIEVSRSVCGGEVTPMAVAIPLDETHTYVNSEGDDVQGYAAGDTVWEN